MRVLSSPNNSDGSINQLIKVYFSTKKNLGFSNQERLAEPLINFYIINCQVTKTIENAQVPPRETWEGD